MQFELAPEEPTWSLGTAALRGASRWSDVYLPEELWETYARASAHVTQPSEVYIAIAITEGIPGATAAFELMYFDVIEQSLTRVGAYEDEIEWITRRMRERLFSPVDGHQPWISALAGGGKLRSLLRDEALRVFVDLRAGR